MYTMTMAQDLTQTHTGFYILCLCCCMILWMTFSCIREMGIGPISGGTIIAMVALMSFGGYISYYSDAYHTPDNTPVTAKFLRYQPEEQRHSCGTSKQPSTCYTNKMYGVFEVPEGTVIFEVSKQSPMPAYITLYKN